MSANPLEATQPHPELEEAFRRMLAARDRIHQRYWSPKAMGHFDSDPPEVLGIQDPRWMRKDAKSPESL